MLILKPLLHVYNSHISTQPLAGGGAGGREWTVRVRLLSSLKPWSGRRIHQRLWNGHRRAGKRRTISLVPGPTPDVPCNRAWPCNFDHQSVSVMPCGLGCYPAFLSKERIPLGQQKKALIAYGTVRNSAFLLLTLCMPCEKEVCLKSFQALKNRNGHGTSQGSLNCDWILKFFDQTSSLENVWALNFGYWHFRNTTFWSVSLGPLKTLQIKPDLWFSPFPY